MGQKYLKCSKKVRHDLVTKQQLSDLGTDLVKNFCAQKLISASFTSIKQ